DWAVNNSYPEASGWAFEYSNVYYPDTDDTAMVLMALRLVQPKEQHSLDELFRRALGWQLSFQCRDGGWAAFDKDVTTPWLEDMPFADHNAILDPTCSDLTARTLELLGYIGFDRNAKCVRDAIKYLVATQDDEEITGTGFPRTFYLKYDMYRQNFPLLALATYVNRRSGMGYHPGFYRCDR